MLENKALSWPENGAWKAIDYGYGLTLVTLQAVLTGYPDAELFMNLRHNVQVNVPNALLHVVDVEGYKSRHYSTCFLIPQSKLGKGFDLMVLDQYALRICVA